MAMLGFNPTYKSQSSLNRRGVMTMDVGCAELSGALIERYLRLKRENRL